MFLWPLLRTDPARKVRRAYVAVYMEELLELLHPPDGMVPVSVHYEPSTRQVTIVVEHADLRELNPGEMLPRLWPVYTETLSSQVITAHWENDVGGVLTESQEVAGV